MVALACVVVFLFSFLLDAITLENLIADSTRSIENGAFVFVAEEKEKGISYKDCEQLNKLDSVDSAFAIEFKNNRISINSVEQVPHAVVTPSVTKYVGLPSGSDAIVGNDLNSFIASNNGRIALVENGAYDGEIQLVPNRYEERYDILSSHFALVGFPNAASRCVVEMKFRSHNNQLEKSMIVAALARTDGAAIDVRLLNLSSSSLLETQNRSDTRLSQYSWMFASLLMLLLLFVGLRLATMERNVLLVLGSSRKELWLFSVIHSLLLGLVALLGAVFAGLLYALVTNLSLTSTQIGLYQILLILLWYVLFSLLVPLIFNRRSNLLRILQDHS